MKEQTTFYEGYLYRIQHVSSNCFYGNRQTYHIRTNNPNWCARVLPKVLGDESITKGEYTLLNKRFPSMGNYLQKYHTVEFVEQPEDKIFEGYYNYTIVKPYDD